MIADKDPTDARQDLFRYLADVRSHYATYHNHKEATTWAATGVYLLLALQFASALPKYTPVSCAGKGTLSAVIILVTSLFLTYLYRQFMVTRKAAGYVGACFQLGARLLSDPSYMPSSEELAPATGDAPSPPIQSRTSLPRILISTSDVLTNRALPNRRKLEALAYLLIVIGCSALLAHLWIF